LRSYAYTLRLLISIVTRVIMFTGKGGVGKTTCSAAAAMHYATSGFTLAISTDVTPSLSHIFEVGREQKPVNVLPDLSINEIGEREVREMWDRKFGREVYEVFSAFVDIDYEPFVEFVTSVLPGLSEEFMVDYIKELAFSGVYETIVWDTAPLGQTLALLGTPALLGEHLRMAPRVYSRVKLGQFSRKPVMDILKRWAELSAEDVEFLKTRVEFVLVTIPEALAVEQLPGAFRDLEKYGLSIRQIIINNVVKFADSRFLQTKASQQQVYLNRIHEKYRDLKIVELPMFPQEVKGIERLKAVDKSLF
jgi:arsenite/tail-anchored protein-transporting ATPase